ncbi:hypothetical protein AU14_06895 [Marinobacter similis]|uniref:Uncharacterized protein n=1 Tax=Marinobacter similis TaxID=1420916 RepID=W5YLU7_9GAMM|nr:hypothetical protein AU14_06895 [Marinobacter similis]
MVVEEQTANAPGFVPMLEVEIVVTPVFEMVIETIPERLAGGPRSLVPMHTVVLKAVIRGEVITAAKPVHRLGVRSVAMKNRTLAWDVGT